MSFKTKPGYTADTQAEITSSVPDSEDGSTAYAVLEGTSWQLNKTSSATVGANVLATKSGTGRWIRMSQQPSVTMEWQAQGIAGIHQTNDTTWTAIGTVYLDPSLLGSTSGAARQYRIQADLEVVEASPGTVTAELRLVDSSLTVVGTVTSTLGGASAFPEHIASSLLTPGTGNGQIRPTGTTYLVQLRRQGGSSEDIAMCHNAFVGVTWS